MSSHYFSPDGNWGEATGLLVLNTTDWTDKMFDLIDEASDSDKTKLAKHFSEREHAFDLKNGGYCDDCGLEACELGMTDLCVKNDRYPNVIENDNLWSLPSGTIE